MVLSYGRLIANARAWRLPGGGLALALSLWGCASGGVHYVPPRTFEEVAAPPRGAYLLNVGDDVQIDVLWHPELQTTQTIRPDGRITAPGQGDVEAAGRTVAEVDSALTAIYSRQLLNPQVSVILRRTAELRVYAFGELKLPGSVTYIPGMRFLDVMAAAGGVTKLGQMNTALLVKRHGPKGTPIAYRLNANHALSSGGAKENPPVEAYDIVYVPRSLIGQASVIFEQLLIAAGVPGDLYLKGWDISREGVSQTIQIAPGSQ